MVYYMRLTEFLGKQVVDNQGMVIGKVSDMIIDPKEGLISRIIISAAEFSIRKKEIVVTTNELSEVGDYVLLKVAVANIEESSAKQ